jgi:hypothetical protein
MPRRHLSVDLELAPQWLAGTVTAEDGASERFESWLEFMSAVERRRPRGQHGHGPRVDDAGREANPATEANRR